MQQRVGDPCVVMREPEIRALFECALRVNQRVFGLADVVVSLGDVSEDHRIVRIERQGAADLSIDLLDGVRIVGRGVHVNRRIRVGEHGVGQAIGRRDFDRLLRIL